MHPVIRLSLCWAASLSSIAAVVGLAVPPRSQAQTYPPCQPPRPNEYLLIVLNPTDEVQTQLRNALPANATATICTYIADTVLRVDGFNSSDTAESWAQYVSDSSGVRAFVARPVAATAAVPPANEAAPLSTPPIVTATPPAAITPPTATTADPFPQPTSLAPPSPTPAVPPTPVASPVATAPTAPTAPNPTSYNPQPLGAGYAVLVDYANRPEVAIELRQALSRDVGLVAYGQRPYLLAAQTTDLAAANAILQSLNGQNFTALIVNSQSAILLTPVVAKLDP